MTHFRTTPLARTIPLVRVIPMARTIPLAIGLLLAVGAGRADAAQMSARDLAAACGGDATARATCNGYLMAVTDAVLQRESRGGNGGRRMCVPDTVTVDQVREGVVRFQGGKATEAPTGIRLVTAAMRATWPCANDASGGTGNGGRRHGGRNRGNQDQ